ncbi:hypothetical protein [Mogibacterium pumilum]|uniref:Peptidase C51 domain-containing protein n=1 Tax=Mogibacterium pumilum TaxID=86332 RepID=A0A223AQW2_9FIRM|nr:hypothetical protein [Mogibacterium pumilum]ASS37336.1 hypothetical protein AXF17_01845 [Mogibacterium pumilum]
MAKTANYISHMNNRWRHVALTFACVSMLVCSFCLVANASTEEDATTETVTNETAVEARQSETVTQTEQGEAATETQEGTNNKTPAEAVDRTRETRVAAASSNNIADAPSVTGTWKREAGGWRFYNKSGVMQKGFCYIDGKKYYFGPTDGLMKAGWQKVGRYYYYLGAAGDGSAKIGWQYVGGLWYYFQINGVMSYGMADVGSSVYYFGSSSDGAMKTGWQTIYDLYYYFGGANDGAMKKGWQYVGGNWYYFDETGYMYSGRQNIGGKNYYLGAANDGAMKTGWQKVGSEWMYLNGSGDGSAKTGWNTVGGYWYYFDRTGLMKTGWQTISGSLYYLGGANDGSMKTGWFKEGNNWYYSNGSGVAQKGWQQIGGYWYYLESNYALVRDTIKNIAGRNYVFNADGVMMTKSFTFKGRKYIADESGAVMSVSEPSNVIDYGIQFLGENGDRFNDWYYNGNIKYRSWAWCNTFVSYVMYNCGINFKKTAYVPNAEQWMHSNYKWVDYKDAKAGDVIVFCWSGQGHNSGRGDRDHIGFLISKNADGTFTTLEGNTNNGKVAIRTRYSKNIRNIFSPKR